MSLVSKSLKRAVRVKFKYIGECNIRHLRCTPQPPNGLYANLALTVL